MKKRPLGVGTLAVCLLVFLVNRLWSVPWGTQQERFEETTSVAGSEVKLTGRVYKKETVSRESGSAQVVYLKLLFEDAGKNVICYLKDGQELPEMGAAVAVCGKKYEFEKASNPGQFDAYSYYGILKISYRLNQTVILNKTTKYDHFSESLYRLRCLLSDKLEQCLPKEDAAVMQAMLLGEKGGMEKELKALYQRNGIAHVLAISGLHISLLGMGLFKLLKSCGIPRKAAAVVSVLIMVPYGIMTGLALSAIRAILMFALRMAAVVLDRSYDMLTAAGIAALLLVLQQPLYLQHSGFLFSFGCVAGIGVLLPALTTAKEGKEKPGGLMGVLLSGLTMTVITLPVYLCFYYQFPPYSFFLNLLILPLMSLLMAAGLLTLFAQLILPGAGLPGALLVSGILEVYERLCRAAESLPVSVMTPGRPQIWQMAVYFGLLFLVILFYKKWKLWIRWAVTIAAVLCLMAGTARGLTVTFLDVGQGDCIYVENPGGGRYLIDGGSSSVNSVGEYRILPFLKYQGTSELEAVFVTHPDEDHCNGILELLETGAVQGIRVRNLVLADIAEESRDAAYMALVQAAEEAGIPVSYISRGQILSDGRLCFTCLHPEKGYETADANAYSTVLGVKYGSFTVLLTGDVEGEGETRLVSFLEEKGLTRKEGLTVLKAAHHGSKNSTPQELLELLNPAYTVISCGEGNSYGHPHRELLERLAACGTKVETTFETGAVSFWTDGKRVKVERFYAGSS